MTKQKKASEPEEGIDYYIDELRRIGISYRWDSFTLVGKRATKKSDKNGIIFRGNDKMIKQIKQAIIRFTFGLLLGTILVVSILFMIWRISP